MGYLQLYRQTDTVLQYTPDRAVIQTDRYCTTVYSRRSSYTDREKSLMTTGGAYAPIRIYLSWSYHSYQQRQQQRPDRTHSELHSAASFRLNWSGNRPATGWAFIYCIGPNTAGRLLHRVQHSWPITLPTSQRESTILFSVFKHLEDNTICSLCVTNMEADYHTDNFLRYAPASVYCVQCTLLGSFNLTGQCHVIYNPFCSTNYTRPRKKTKFVNIRFARSKFVYQSAVFGV